MSVIVKIKHYILLTLKLILKPEMITRPWSLPQFTYVLLFHLRTWNTVYHDIQNSAGWWQEAQFSEFKKKKRKRFPKDCRGHDKQCL